MRHVGKPIKHKDAYTEAVEAKLVAYFNETIFEPLVAILEDAKVPEADEVRLNAITTALLSALNTGRVWYADGAFYGEFSAAISRELRSLGATFDGREDVFRFPQGELPLDLRNAVYASIDRSRGVHERVGTFLEAAEENIALAATGIEIEQTLSRIRGDLYKQLEQTVPQTALEFVEVSADVTPAISKAIAEEFTNNLDKYVKNFLWTEIPELRAEVQANAFAGYRADRLAKLIEARYGVTKRKAAFLADQETGLFIAKFRESRYKEVGIRQYKWSTSHDERVRADHRLLDGEIFSWDSPPVTNRKTGARNHPGEDYRCRCVPIPILNIAERGNSRPRELRCARAA